MAKLPPGTRSRLLSTYRALTNPIEYSLKWRDKYGDPFLIRAFNGTAAFTGDPKLIRQIFSANPDIFAPFAASSSASLVGPRSIFLLTGEAHKRERKLLMPPFHGERMRAYGDIIVEAARHHIATSCGGSPTKAIDLTQAISLEVIIRAVFGVQDDARVAAFTQAIRNLMGASHPILFFAPMFQRRFFGLGPYDKFIAAYELLDRLLQQQVEDTREHPGEDILSMLLSARFEDGSPMPDSSIRDELRTLLFAGHETTAVALAWAIDQVHRTPGVLDRLQAELSDLGEHPSPEQLVRLPYLEGVCKETLRLYPILTEVLRLLVQPMQLGDYTMPAGTGVAASIALVHNREDLYPDPQAFKPERFIQRRFSPFEYLPFGGGMRRCIGAAFAMYELKLVLATLVSESTVELCQPQTPKPTRRGLTLAPEGGVPIRLTRR